MNLTTITAGSWIGFLGKGLAPRELEATAYAANDLTTKEIARLMGITPKVVSKRLDGARFKLGARTVRGLVMEALQRGLIAAVSCSAPADPGHQHHHDQDSHDGVLLA